MPIIDYKNVNIQIDSNIILEDITFSLNAGEFAYITGAVFYSFHKVKYIHTVFHFFVLLGTVCHMIAMWFVIKGML